MKIKQLPEDFLVKELSTVVFQEKGKFKYFLLQKKNRTTLGVLQMLAVRFNTTLKMLGYAGNKDKVAITEQVCSAKGVSREAIERVDIPDVQLTYLGAGDKPISLGDLSGNQFTITVRDIDELPSVKEKSNSGFINYFGEQRFSTDNAVVGKALVKKDFKTAAEILSKDNASVRESLASLPTDFLRAIKTVPLRILQLYVHSYQSDLWNKAVQQCLLKHKLTQLSLPGFAMEREECIDAIMKQESVSERDFVIPQFPELSAEGGMRDLFVKVQDFTMGKLEADELNPGRKKAVLQFTLGKGSYATEVVRQLFEESA